MYIYVEYEQHAGKNAEMSPLWNLWPETGGNVETTRRGCSGAFIVVSVVHFGFFSPHLAAFEFLLPCKWKEFYIECILTCFSIYILIDSVHFNILKICLWNLLKVIIETYLYIDSLYCSYIIYIFCIHNQSESACLKLSFYWLCIFILNKVNIYFRILNIIFPWLSKVWLVLCIFFTLNIALFLPKMYSTDCGYCSCCCCCCSCCNCKLQFMRRNIVKIAAT